MGKRAYRYDGMCPGCGVRPKDDHQGRYCLECRRALRRAYWARAGGSAGLSAEAKRRANVRTYTRVLVQRGHLLRSPCLCGESDVQAHHLEYEPRAVVWLCRRCHQIMHEAGVR